MVRQISGRQEKRIIRGRKPSTVEQIKRYLQPIFRDPDWLLRIRGHFDSLRFYLYAIQLKYSPPNPSRFLICIPRGGLNDVLCQIQACLFYAIRTRRILLVDTADSTIGDLQALFDTSSVPGLNNFKSFSKELLKLDIWPPINIDKLLKRECDVGWSEELNGYLTFDFTKDHKEAILVHSGRGGGYGLGMLSKMKLREPIRTKVLEKLSKLPKQYDALQVRNTDVKANLSRLLETAKQGPGQRPLLLCTDDDNIISHIKSKLGAKRTVFLLRPLRANASKPLHYDTEIPQDERNINLMVDLLAMSAARRLYVARQENEQLSGFPRLAKALHAQPKLANHILAPANHALNE